MIALLSHVFLSHQGGARDHGMTKSLFVDFVGQATSTSRVYFVMLDLLLAIIQITTLVIAFETGELAVKGTDWFSKEANALPEGSDQEGEEADGIDGRDGSDETQGILQERRSSSAATDSTNEPLLCLPLVQLLLHIASASTAGSDLSPSATGNGSPNASAADGDTTAQLNRLMSAINSVIPPGMIAPTITTHRNVPDRRATRSASREAAQAADERAAGGSEEEGLGRLTVGMPVARQDAGVDQAFTGD